jgi:hypothetical protein|tara:strand:- start:4 stop:249 length:246 start_codon:yes stop_codon:yes gene_type:complete
MAKMKKQELVDELIWVFWELDEDENFEAGQYEIVNQRETGKFLKVIVLNNGKNTFKKYDTVQEAVYSIPMKDLKTVEYGDE